MRPKSQKGAGRAVWVDELNLEGWRGIGVEFHNCADVTGDDAVLWNVYG
jgi:hypothetical protein